MSKHNLNASLETDLPTQQLDSTSSCERSPVSVIRVGVDHESIRIQFPSTMSQKYWGQRQKYFYPGLRDSPSNLLLAELVLKQIEVDIAFNLFDASFEKYKQLIQERQTSHSESESSSFVEQVISRINRVVGRISLYELFTQYCEYKKPILEETTYKLKYQNVYGRLLKECPQSLSEPLAIRKYIVEHRLSSTAKRVLRITGASHFCKNT